MCERYHCLPSELFEQDPWWIERMKIVIEAKNEKDRIAFERQQKGSK